MFKITSNESIIEMENAVQRAKEAQIEFAKFSQEDVDRVVKSIAEAAFLESKSLAQLAVTETGMGVYEHKVMKNELGSMGVYESIKDEKTVGVIRKDHRNKLTEIAYPFGVVAAICPTTNPTSTAIYKTLISIKAQNGIVVSPHPKAAQCTVEALKICSDAAIKAGAPEGLIGWIANPTMDATTQLLKHKDVNLILATGGGGLVRAAYSSGKPAYGVGPGNGPAYIEMSGNVKQAIQKIIDSKSFDNGTLCSTETAIIVHRNIKEITKREIRNNGGYIVNENEKHLLENIISPVRGKLNPDIVGQSAVRIAEMAGINVPDGTRVLVAEETKVGKDIPLSIEKLSPILGMYTVENTKSAIELCESILNIGGRGHTCSIHTNDESVAEQFGLAMPVSRVIVNSLASIGAAGATTALMPSLTLGCGSYGGNISSDNITAKHLVNIKRIAFGIKDVSVPKPNSYTNTSKMKVEKKASSDSINNLTSTVTEKLSVNHESISKEQITHIVNKVIQEYMNN